MSQFRKQVQKTSINLAEERLQQLADLFPEAFREGKIDFDSLRAALGETVLDPKNERFSFTWAGKKDAVRLAQTPSRATLIPAVEESVNWDSTSNIFIEGDNLEALKLLGRSYFGRVKMIYIDPPYNTGNDFIYPDNYSDPLKTYLEMTGQIDANGNRLTSNTESNGRFHSAWLSMMYPRLVLARQFLRDDGVIFVSIDDHEVHHLRQLMNEVFGEENFIGQLIWERAYAPKNDAKFISNSHDYVLMFAKNINNFTIGRLDRTEKTNAPYGNPDDDPRGLWRSDNLSVKTYTAANDYPITTPSGRVVEPPAGRCWSLSKKAFFERLQDNRIWFGVDGNGVPSIKRFLSEVKEGLTPTSILFYKEVGHSQEGAQEVTALFEAGVFDGPKPVRLIERLLTLANLEDDSIVMDFFSGSASTAHAVMKMNAEKEMYITFIMVQLPEVTPEGGTAIKAGYKTIADIAKERIRRVIKQMVEAEAGKLDGFEQTPPDLGFRVFKLGPSNYRQWQPTEETDDILQQLELMAQSLLIEGWKPKNVIFEVAIKEGYGLNAQVDEVDGMDGNTVYRVTDPNKAQIFYICLDDKLPADLLIRLRLTAEDLFICRDSALDDTLAANFALQARLKTL